MNRVMMNAKRPTIIWMVAAFVLVLSALSWASVADMPKAAQETHDQGITFEVPLPEAPETQPIPG